jgi:hypothetical protein
MTDDDLAALDAEQTDTDMRRAERAPGVYSFPIAHNETEAWKAEDWIAREYGIVLPTRTRTTR